MGWWSNLLLCLSQLELRLSWAVTTVLSQISLQVPRGFREEMFCDLKISRDSGNSIILHKNILLSKFPCLNISGTNGTWTSCGFLSIGSRKFKYYSHTVWGGRTDISTILGNGGNKNIISNIACL